MEFGTPNILGIASLWAGQDWIEEKGIENIHRQERELAQKLVNAFRQIEGVTIYGCENMNEHLSTVSINISGWEAGDVGIMLDVDYNIATRTGLQCAPLVHKQIGTLQINGTVRFSIGAFNTENDIDSAIFAVKEIAKNARKKKK
jgi:selenocysteine lyase/cysteine desulfurase